MQRWFEYRWAWFKAWYLRKLAENRRRTLWVTGLVAFFIFLSIPAQFSHPGDFLLYSYKVNITETLISSVPLYTTARINLYGSLGIKRLGETEYLVARGYPSRSTLDTVDVLFEGYMQEAQNEALRLEELQEWQTLSTVESGLESTLRAHEAALAYFNQEGERRDSLSPLITSVRTAINQAQSLRIEAEQHLSASKNVQVAARSDAEASIKAAHAFIDAHTDSIPPDELAVSSQMLTLAESSLAQGVSQESVGNASGAYLSFRDAMRFGEIARASGQIWSDFSEQSYYFVAHPSTFSQYFSGL